MKRSNRVLLLLGVGLAVVAFLGVLAVGSMGQAPTGPTVENVTVVVAAQELPIGTELTPEMLTTGERPVPQAADTYRTPAELAGTVIRRTVSAGHVLRVADFEGNQSQVDIAGSIGAGLRGIAVSLDQVDGIGYLLQPGDYVDVVLTLTDDNPISVPNPKYPSESDEPLILLDNWTNNTSVKVLVQNVQVMATLDPRAAEASNTVSAGVAAIEPVMVAILAVTPQQAEMVRFAQISGDVSLILRSPNDRTAGDVPTTGVTLKQLVDNAGVLPPAPVAP